MSSPTLPQTALMVALLAVLAAVLTAKPPAPSQISCSAFSQGFCQASCNFAQVKETCCRCFGDCCPADGVFQEESKDEGKQEEPGDEALLEERTAEVLPEKPTASSTAEEPTSEDSQEETADEDTREEPADESKPEEQTDESALEELGDAGSPEKLVLAPKSTPTTTVTTHSTSALPSSAVLACTEQEYPVQVRADGTIWHSLASPCQLLQCNAGAITVLLNKCAPTAATAASLPSTSTTPPVGEYLPCEDDDTGDVYVHGETWRSAVTCVTLRCMNGLVQIAKIGCHTTAVPPPPVPTDTAGAIPLPEASRTAERACVDKFGQLRHSGAVWTLPFRPCLRYSCDDGTVSNAPVLCTPPAAGCTAVPPPAGQCCPDYRCPLAPADCTYGGTTYRSGEQFPDDPVHPCQQKRCDDGLVVALSPPAVCPPVYCAEPDWPVGNCCRTCPEEPLPLGLEELKQLVLRMGQRLNLRPARMAQLEDSISQLVTQLAALLRGSGSTATVQTLVTNVIKMLDILNTPSTGVDVSFSSDTEFMLGQLRLRMTSLVDLLRPALNDDQINNAAIDIHEFIAWLRAFEATNSDNAAAILMNDLTRFFSGLLQEPGCVDATGMVHSVNSLYVDNPAAPQFCFVCANTSAGVAPLLVMNATDCGGPPPAGCSAHLMPNSCCPLIQCSAGEAACRDQRGELHQHGTTYVDDPKQPCTTYSCTNGVITIVDQITCLPIPAGCTPWQMDGVCCPQSDCPKPSCTYHSRERDHGTTWPHEPMRPCLILTCLDGQVTSEDLSPRCRPSPAPNCVPRLVNYQCCPEYDCVTVNCTYRGRVYSEGETWPDDSQYPCKRYRCTRQGTEKIQDLAEQCATQPHSNCTSRRVSGQCCKEWDCPECAYGGRSYSEGAIFWDNPDRRCAQSVCRVGQVVQLTPQTACPPVPDGCTPNYVGNSCCHVNYTCPFCMFDPQGNFIQTVDAGVSGFGSG